MMFGWTGLACTAQFHLSYTHALLIALAIGIGMMLITALIMHCALKLESPGSVFSNRKAVGQIGMIYQRIPAHGQGKIHITIDNVTRELLAQSAELTTLESFTLVKVVKAIDHEIVEVIEHRKELQ